MHFIMMMAMAAAQSPESSQEEKVSEDAQATDASTEMDNKEDKKAEQEAESEEEDDKISLVQSLKEIAKLQPDTEYLDLSNQGISSIDELEPHIYGFKNLRELNLEDNEIKSLPQSFVDGLPQLEIVNLNGNELHPFERAVDKLK